MKDERTAEQIGAWHDALHQAQAMRLQGVGDRAIARTLNAHGYVTERTKPWSTTCMFSQALKRPPGERRLKLIV